MRRFLTGLFAVAVLAGSALVPTATAKTCPSDFTHATIGGVQKCLHAGEYCSHAEARQYRRYQFKCVLVNGVYRLEYS
jgi:hypothetical protein